MQMVAVAIIAKQLKALNVLPTWVDVDFRGLYKLVPRNPWIVRPCGHLPTRHVLLISENVVLPDGLTPAAVLVKRHRIIRVVPGTGPAGAAAIAAAARTTESLGGIVHDVGELLISPGLVDLHVHMNEPGRMHWEGIIRGTRAAAAGGVTTVVDMPLNCLPPITSLTALNRKLSRIWQKARVDVAQWGGLVHGNARDGAALAAMLRKGVVGLKAFMSPTGTPEYESVDRADIEAALPVLLRHRKPLMLHAELISDAVGNGTCEAGCDTRSHATWAAARPPEFEVSAAKEIVAALRAVRGRNGALWANATSARGGAFGVHIAHLASVDALSVYEEGRAEGLPITVEVTPHHLVFAAEDAGDGATELKCAPPLRPARDRDALRAALGAGRIHAVGSDHSPAPLAMKAKASGDFLAAWGGIAGLQYTLPAVNSLREEHGWTFAQLAGWLSTGPAAIAGLGHRKGRIQEDYDADLVVWAPYAAANTSEGGCFHRHKLTPFRGLPLPGRVVATFVRGAMVFNETHGVWEKYMCGSAVKLPSRG